MKSISKVVKYNTFVFSNTEMDEARKEECLCLNCDSMSNCAVAKVLYKICCDENVAMMITRCPNWKNK